MQHRTDFALMRATLASLLGIACSPNAPGSDSTADDGTGSAGPQSTGEPGDGSGDTGTATGSGGSCAPPLPATACTDDVPLVLQGLEREGWFQCGDGLMHRVTAATCEVPAADGCDPDGGTGSGTDGGTGSGTDGGTGSGTDGGTGSGTPGECNVDSDCMDAPNGRCLLDTFFEPNCGCTYACQTDTDCAADEACLCGGVGSRCIPAQCHVDADCGEGSSCTLATADSSCGTSAQRLTCTTTADACNDASDCSPSEDCVKLDDDACGFRCEASPQACADAGRPFIVDHAHRTARACPTDGWCGSAGTLADSVATLAPELRARLAEHWTRAGLAEHASVASFARFVMQLLALGAPADLVDGAQRALADEVDHARRCFSIASVYADRPVGPGSLSMAAALDGAHDLVSITEAVFVEGCVGETLAAAEVAEASQWAEHPELRAALRAIAEDELRHAALAWQFVAWAVAQASREERAQIMATIRRRIAEFRAEGSAMQVANTSDVRAHGVLTRQERRCVHIQAFASVVVPCAQDLRGGDPLADAEILARVG